MLLLGGGLVLSSPASGTTAPVPDGQSSLAPPDTVSPLQYHVRFATGYSQITTQQGNADTYVSLSILPELHYRKLGIGLLARLHVQPWSGTLREQDFDRVSDYLGLVYFVEYGQESDTTEHVRLGVLEDVSFGYGHFVDHYANDVSLDDPMRGITGALNIGHVRLEGLFNSLARPGVLGAHGAYFPFGKNPDSVLPRMQVGLSLAGDVNRDGSQVNTVQPGEPFLLSSRPGNKDSTLPVGTDDGALFMVGIDAGMRILQTETLSLLSFAEASKILDHGIGASFGLRAATEVGSVQVHGRYVQHVLGPEFLPGYFDSTYEAQRIRRVSLPGEQAEDRSVVNTKRNRLLARQSAGFGYQTRISVEYNDSFESSIRYRTVLGDNSSDKFTFDFRLHSAKVPVTLRIGYDRFGIDRWSDIFVPSREDALYRLGAAYQIIPQARLGVNMRQTYDPVFRGGREVGRSKETRFEPFIFFTIQL